MRPRKYTVRASARWIAVIGALAALAHVSHREMSDRLVNAALRRAGAAS